jgi:hypothetical protein
MDYLVTHDQAEASLLQVLLVQSILLATTSRRLRHDQLDEALALELPGSQQPQHPSSPLKQTFASLDQ